MSSIRNRLILGFSLCILLPILVLSIILGINQYHSSRELFAEFSKNQIGQIDQTLTVFFGEVKKTAKHLLLLEQNKRIDNTIFNYINVSGKVRKDPIAAGGLNKEFHEEYRRINDAHPDVIEIYLGTEYGGYISSLIPSMGNNYDPRKRAWYIQAINTPDLEMTPAYMPLTSPDPVVSIVARTNDKSGKPNGAIGVDVTLKGVTKMINEQKIGKTGYAILYQNDGTILADPKNPENNFKTIKDLNIEAYNQFDTLLEQSDYVVINGEKYLASVHESKELGWKIVGLVTEAEIKKAVNATLFTMILTGLVLFVIFIVLGYIFAQKLTAPLVATTEVLDELSQGEGDLTVRLEVLSNDEVGQLASSFNLFLEKLQLIIKDIVGINTHLSENSLSLNDLSTSLANGAITLSEQVESVTATTVEISSNSQSISAAAEEASTNVSSVAAATEEMSSNVNTVASAAEQASTNVTIVVDNMNTISDNMNAISEKINDVSTHTNTTAAAIEEMNASLQEVSRGTIIASDISQKANDQAQTTGNIMDTLKKSAQEVGKVVNIINDIADQTNMLALNATIEAASAGDAGKGFAVVANEVKELAKQTGEATGKISTQIEEMQIAASNSVQSIADITNIIKELNSIITNIASSVEEQSATINEIAAAIAMAANHSQDVNDFTKTVAELVKNVNRNVQEAGSGVDEIARSSSEVALAANEVSRNSNEANLGVSEIAQNTSEITIGINQISDRLSEVNFVSSDTSGNANGVKNAADQLVELANNLNQLVGKFKV